LVNSFSRAATADSGREMLAKCRQSGSMTVMADDTESAADADQQGVTLFAGDVSSPPSHAVHPLTGLHCIVVGGSGCVSALPARCQTLCHCR